MKDAGKVLEDAILAAYDGFTTLANGNKDRVIRCPSCLDSDNLNHGHLYISRVPPFYYLCHRCKFSGAVNESFLKLLGVAITPELQEIIAQNRNAVKEDVKTKNISSRKQITSFLDKKQRFNQLAIPPFDRAAVIRNLPKYRYLCERFNVKVSKEEIELFKVVFDLKDFVRYNSIMNLPVDTNYMNILNNDYIGFMNYSYEGIINRNIVSTDKEHRYYDLMFSKSPFRIYTFNQKLDITQSRLKLVIAEGIFDVIGIYYAFPQLRDHTFAAMLGHGINSVLKFFVSLGFLDQEILIFSDGDVAPEEYKAQLWKYRLPIDLKFKVHYMRNSKGHDFGVSKDLIEIKNSINLT